MVDEVHAYIDSLTIMSVPPGATLGSSLASQTTLSSYPSTGKYFFPDRSQD